MDSKIKAKRLVDELLLELQLKEQRHPDRPKTSYSFGEASNSDSFAYKSSYEGKLNVKTSLTEENDIMLLGCILQAKYNDDYSEFEPKYIIKRLWNWVIEGILLKKKYKTYEQGINDYDAKTYLTVQKEFGFISIEYEKSNVLVLDIGDLMTYDRTKNDSDDE